MPTSSTPTASAPSAPCSGSTPAAAHPTPLIPLKADSAQPQPHSTRLHCHAFLLLLVDILLPLVRRAGARIWRQLYARLLSSFACGLRQGQVAGNIVWPGVDDFAGMYGEPSIPNQSVQVAWKCTELVRVVLLDAIGGNGPWRGLIQDVVRVDPVQGLLEHVHDAPQLPGVLRHVLHA